MKTTKTTQTPDNQNNKVVCFYRVSTDKQETDRQFDDVRKYCAAYGYEIVKEYEETVSGAAELKDRKELRAMMNYVENNKVQYCVVSELSRVGRSNLTLEIIERLTKLGVCFISLKEGLKTLNSDGTINPTTQLIIDILNGINKFELSTITYRVRSGLRKTVNKGTWSGGMVPFGYDLVDKKLVVNTESDVVIKMFGWYAEGWGTHRIASQLNIDKITTKEGKNWVDTKVYKILSNPIYNGKRLWNKPNKKYPNRILSIIEVPELKIIDDTTFTSVQHRLTNNSNITTINKHQKYDYLLQGKMVCSCGKHYVGQGRHGIYMCASKKYAGGCNTKSVKIDWLDEQLKKHLVVNSHTLLNDYNTTLNKVEEMKSEVLHLQEQIKSEKIHQNDLINRMSKIGLKAFDEKFDDSENLIKKYQSEIDKLNVKISNSKVYMETQPATIIVKEKNRTSKGMDVKVNVDIDKELVRKVVEKINITNEVIKVTLINGNTFNIDRKK